MLVKVDFIRYYFKGVNIKDGLPRNEIKEAGEPGFNQVLEGPQQR